MEKEGNERMGIDGKKLRIEKMRCEKVNKKIIKKIFRERKIRK